MSEKLADHGVLVPVVPPGAVPGSPGPDTTIPTSAIDAAAAMRMPGRRYHGEAASVSSAVRVPFASPESSAIPVACADSAPPRPSSSSVFAAGGSPPPGLLDGDSVCVPTPLSGVVPALASGLAEAGVDCSGATIAAPSLPEAPGVASNTFIAHAPSAQSAQGGGFLKYTSCLQTGGGIGQTGAQVVLCRRVAAVDHRPMEGASRRTRCDPSLLRRPFGSKSAAGLIRSSMTGRRIRRSGARRGSVLPPERA